jgi:hypothetical protein
LREERARCYRSFDFHPVSNDLRIQCELLDCFSVYRATFSGSNSLKARRYPSRFLSTIDQLSPACAASSTELKVFSVIVDRHTPLAIVILDHKGIVHADPGTSFRSHKIRRTLPQSSRIAEGTRHRSASPMARASVSSSKSASCRWPLIKNVGVPFNPLRTPPEKSFCTRSANSPVCSALVRPVASISTCGEMFDSAPGPVALAIGFHRVNRIVVSCPRLEVVNAYAENRR